MTSGLNPASSNSQRPAPVLGPLVPDPVSYLLAEVRKCVKIRTYNSLRMNTCATPLANSHGINTCKNSGGGGLIMVTKRKLAPPAIPPAKVLYLPVCYHARGVWLSVLSSA